MAANESNHNNIIYRFKNILNATSLRTKTNEIGSIFSFCTLKELQVIYPLLLENIFGIGTGCIGWNLRRIHRFDQSDDFDAALRFLYPQGPLVDIAYKLLDDVYSKYEYKVAYLPSPIKNSIEQGTLPLFFMEKLQMDPITRHPSHLLLNSYELLMFHFVYHLVSPWHQRFDQQMSSHHDTVYIHLCQLYSAHLLPVETSTVLPVIQINNLSPRSPPPQVTPMRVSKLFKASALKQLMAAAPVVSQPHAEIWRSEMFLLLASSFWLCAPEPSAKSLLSSPSSSPSFSSANSSLSSFSFGMEGLDSRASGDHLRVVRNLIKHVHYFSNNIRSDGTAMDEMRRSVLSVLRVPAHAFLRHNIHHWPLDYSFTLMLETYLSYIQPWRYLHYTPGSHAGKSTNVDVVWSSFINDNLEIYTSVIKQLISRFSRMDLSSLRYAQMVYRLCKVLQEPQLPELLNQADRNAQMRGDIDHVSIYNQETEVKTIELLHKIRATIALLSEQEQATSQRTSSSYFQSLREWWSAAHEDSSNDRQATISYLEHSAKWLCGIFQVEAPEAPKETSSPVSPSMLDPIFAQKRAAFIKYGGNPDIQPIRSYEWAPLVRFLHRVSASINELHGSLLAELWYRQDLTGRLCRQWLAAPCQTHHFHKTGPGNPAPLVVAMLPPRVCLRPLASHRLLFLIALLMSIPYAFGWSPPIFCLLAILIYVVAVLIKVTLLPYFYSDPGQQEHEPFVPLDISFNE